MPRLVPNRGKVTINSREDFINAGSDDNKNSESDLSIEDKRMMAPRGQLIHTYDDDEKVARTYRIKKKYIIAIAELARNETDVRSKKKVTETDILDRIFSQFFKI